MQVPARAEAFRVVADDDALDATEVDGVDLEALRAALLELVQLVLQRRLQVPLARVAALAAQLHVHVSVGARVADVTGLHTDAVFVDRKLVVGVL